MCWLVVWRWFCFLFCPWKMFNETSAEGFDPSDGAGLAKRMYNRSFASVDGLPFKVNGNGDRDAFYTVFGVARDFTGDLEVCNHLSAMHDLSQRIYNNNRLIIVGANDVRCVWPGVERFLLRKKMDQKRQHSAEWALLWIYWRKHQLPSFRLIDWSIDWLIYSIARKIQKPLENSKVW